MSRRALLSVAIGLVMCSPSLAQEFQKPGPEHKRLAEVEGKWDAVFEMQGQKSKASAVYKSILGGMWIASDFEGDLGGQKFQGHGLDGYDQHKKKYVGIWTDSVSSAPMHMEGDYDASTKTLTMSGESPGPDGKPQKFKNTTVTKDKDHFTFKMYMVGPDGKDNLAFTIEYTRKK